MRISLVLFLCIAATVIAGCASHTPPRGWDELSAAPADEHFRMTALLPETGEPLPFHMSIPSQTANGVAYLHNGDVAAPAIYWRAANEFRLYWPHYEAWMKGEIDSDGQVTAQWGRGGRVRMNVSGSRMTDSAFAERRRFDLRGESESYAAPRTSGTWIAEIDGRSEPAPLYLNEMQGQRVEGSMLYPTGDSGPMTGERYGDTIRLAVFDGARAGLMDVTLEEDGETATGTLRTPYRPQPRRFVAERVGSDEPPHDYFGEVSMRDASARFAPEALAEMDLEGAPVIVTAIGTWCPNSNDAAEALQLLHDRYAE
ncbi:MAG: hypothetical protein VYC34_03535, partial [Planctomycetota bacterium]|nr:hypothetical protein [Planctomycetota bacterium]